MTNIKALIIEDSRLARNELKSLLKNFSDIEIIEEAENADVAFEKINALNPDLIFLDIQMPGKDGFELLESLENVPNNIVFTTAYDEYAVKSFEYNALDYLMKPINPKRLEHAIEKVRINVAKSRQQQQKILHSDDQIFIKEGEKCWLVKTSEIFLFQVDGNYTKVFFRNEKATISRSLNSIEKKLPQEKYFRANRNEIFNIDFAQGIENWFSGNFLVKLPQEKKVEISRRQSIVFKEIFSL